MNNLLRFRLKAVIGVSLFILLTGSCKNSRPEKEEGFSFAFLTDIHVQPELDAAEGFRKAISEVNRLKPDFVLTGGDLVMDVLGQTYERADSLYNLYQETIKMFNMPVYNTIGNHEVFGYYKSSGVDSTHVFYGDKLYENRLGQRYYTFEHKGWRFYILDSVDERAEGGYYGHVDREQIEWLAEELGKVDPGTPLAISVHIPFISVMTQINEGATVPNSDGLVIGNSKEVLDLFRDHNLKLVLQGHLHAYEDIYTNGIHFITGGAVCGNWWKGPRRGMEEGFLMVHIGREEFTSEYIDFGWEITD